jgi:hypothetical protein
VEQLIFRMASENRDWGYDRIARHGHSRVCDFRSDSWQCSATEPKRTTPWSVFIQTHLAPLAGTDFFTAEVLMLRGLVTYYVLFFIHLESRRVDIAGITVHPDESWMKQIACNVTMERWGVLRDCRYLLPDRDTKFTRSFRAIIASGRVEPLALPVRSPNLNAYSERWVRSVNEECLSKVLLIGERSLRVALSEYVAHYHAERNHQGRTTSCCFLVTRKCDEADLCNVAKGWARCCIITTKKPRNLTEQSRMILWLEVDCTCARTAMLMANAQVSSNIALRGRPVKPRRAGQQSTRFNSLNRTLASIF